MTPRLARKELIGVALRRRNAFKRVRSRRSTVPNIKQYLKQQLAGRVHRSILPAVPSSSWICTSTSWTNLSPVGITVSDIHPFHSWTILDEDIGNDNFVGECMQLYSLWIEEIEDEDEDKEIEEMPEMSYSDWAVCRYLQCLPTDDLNKLFGEQIFEEGMRIFADWTANVEDCTEVIVEPEVLCRLPMSMIVSTRALVPAPSVTILRAIATPHVLMSSLAIVLFETRNFNYINDRLSVPSPIWMIDAAVREMDPPNSLVSTVSLPSGWDVISARVSSSSIFNIFSDMSPSPLPSLFNIDPTGIVSSSSMSSLFMDPSSDSCGLCSYSSLFEESLPSSSHDSSFCPDCQRAHSYEDDDESEFSMDDQYYGRDYSESEDDMVDDEFERSRHTYIVSSPSSTSSSSSTSDYDTYVDSEPLLKKVTHTVSASTQTQPVPKNSTTRMMDECDALMEKLVEMKRKLRDLM